MISSIRQSPKWRRSLTLRPPWRSLQRVAPGAGRSRLSIGLHSAASLLRLEKCGRGRFASCAPSSAEASWRSASFSASSALAVDLPLASPTTLSCASSTAHRLKFARRARQLQRTLPSAAGGRPGQKSVSNSMRFDRRIGSSSVNNIPRRRDWPLVYRSTTGVHCWTRRRNCLKVGASPPSYDTHVTGKARGHDLGTHFDRGRRRLNCRRPGRESGVVSDGGPRAAWHPWLGQLMAAMPRVHYLSGSKSAHTPSIEARALNHAST